MVETEPKEYIHTDVLFQIIGNHPHSGEHAYATGQAPDTITNKELFGETVYPLVLTDCKHGIERCYAAKKNMKLIADNRTGQ